MKRSLFRSTMPLVVAVVVLPTAFALLPGSSGEYAEAHTLEPAARATGYLPPAPPVESNTFTVDELRRAVSSEDRYVDLGRFHGLVR